MCQKKKKKKKKKKKNYARAIKPNPQNMGILTRKLDPQKNPAENQLVPLKRVELSKNKKNKKKFNNQHPSPGWKPRPRLSVDYTELKVFFFFLYFLAESALAPASAGWSIADWRSFPTMSAVLPKHIFFLIFYFFCLLFVLVLN
jgi:hypothetical protein